LRASSIGDGRRLCRVPSPSPLSQAAAPQAEAEPVRSWSRSLSLFKKKRSAPDLRTLADEHGRSDGPAALPPLPSVGRGRFVRAFSTAPAATDEKSVPALLSPLVPPRPRQALKTKASLQSLRSRSPFRPQTPSSPPPPTPPPLPLDVDPFAFLPIATRSTSPHPAASARRARPVRLSKDADGPYAARPRSHTSPVSLLAAGHQVCSLELIRRTDQSSVAPPSNVLSLLIPPEPLPSSFQLVLPSPKQLLAPLSSPVTPLSDASDERQRDERGRSRSYGGDTSDRAPPPPGPNRALTGPRRPLPPARRDGDDGEDRRPPHRRAAVNEFGAEASTSSSSSDSSGSDSDESESDFRTPLETTPDDDDVPLAVAHPTTALAAQKSLRLDRRKEKSAERSRRKAERRRVDSPPSRRRTGPGTSNLSLPQEPRRQAKDLPSAYGVASMDGVFRAEDLERKLRDLERAASLRPGLDGDGGPSLPRSRMDSTTLSPHQAGSASVDRIKGSSMPPPTLSRKASAANIALAPPVLSRKASATSIGLASTLPPLPGQSSLSRARSQSAIKPKVPQPPARGVRQVSATRPHSPTHEPAAAAMQRKGSEPLSGAAGRHRSLSSAARRPSTNPADVPPLPPLPGSSTNFPSPNLASGNTQQSSAAMSRRPTLSGLGPVPELDRLRIASQPSRLLTVSLEHGDVARTMRIDVPDSTTAGGLLELLKAKGELPTGRSGENLLKGELAVWERGDEWAVGESHVGPGPASRSRLTLLFVRPERPLRDYEVLSQVLAGWNPAKRENSFVIKRCSLCECLTLRVRLRRRPLLSRAGADPVIASRPLSLSAGDPQPVPERRRLGSNLLVPQEEVVQALPRGPRRRRQPRQERACALHLHAHPEFRPMQPADSASTDVVSTEQGRAAPLHPDRIRLLPRHPGAGQGAQGQLLCAQEPSVPVLYSFLRSPPSADQVSSSSASPPQRTSRPSSRTPQTSSTSLQPTAGPLTACSVASWTLG